MAKSRTPLKECSEGPGWESSSWPTWLLHNFASDYCSLACGLVQDCRKATLGDKPQHLTSLLCKPVAESWGGSVFQATARGWLPQR